MKRSFKSELATLDELKVARLQNLMAPIQTSDGSVFQFGRDDRETMEGALLGLSLKEEGYTVGWRQLDNTEIPVTRETLQAYYDELVALQAERGLEIDLEYMTFKNAGTYTKREILDWTQKYFMGTSP